MSDTSTSKLIRALQEARAPAWIVHKAAANQYNDFKSDSATPIVDLVRDLRSQGFEDLAQRAMHGEFDATKEESDEWARSPEGQEILRRGPLGTLFAERREEKQEGSDE